MEKKERKTEERGDEMEMKTDDGAEAVATVPDQDIANTEDRPRVLGYLMDDALNILVRDVTESFGFAPCDVYEAILDPQEARKIHTSAIRRLNYPVLKALVKEFSENMALAGTSHELVAVHPRRIDDFTDDWAIDFKSVSIAGEVVERMRVQEEDQLREMCEFFHGYMEGSNFAGWAFEAIVGDCPSRIL